MSLIFFCIEMVAFLVQVILVGSSKTPPHLYHMVTCQTRESGYPVPLDRNIGPEVGIGTKER